MLNKKILVALALIGASSIVHAGCDSTRYNIGGEISLPTYLRHNDWENSKPGANAFVGARFNQHVGIEGGVGFIPSRFGRSYWPGNGTNANVYFDALGFMPITKKFELVGGLGVGLAYQREDYLSSTKSYIGNHTLNAGVRVSGGAQYNFTQNWAARAMVRNQTSSYPSITLGLLYSFK